MITSFLALVTVSTLPVESADTLRNVMLDDIEIVSNVKEHGLMRQQPSAVTLMGIEQLEAMQATSLKSASRMVPNLFIPDYGSRLTSAIYIRGIGSRINTPAVGLYVDNIPYVDKSAFDFNFYDIERVDVLRGPQGTLYGRNTMGGLVKVYTLDPFHGEGTTLRMGYASGDNHRNLSLTHFHRVADNIAFSAGGYYEGGDGFFSNDLTGKKVDDIEAGGGRIRAIWLPSQQWKLDASVSYDYSDEGAYPYFHEGTISNNREHSYRRSMLNTGANIEYVADSWQMNAITGYQHLRDRMFMDQDFREADIYTLEQNQLINTLSEEVTFKSRNSDFWQHVSGLNLTYQWLDTDGPVNFLEDGVSSLIEGNINGVFSRLQQDYPKMPNMSIALQNRQFEVSSEMQTPTFSAALFHQSTLALGCVDFTLGARLEYNDRRLDYLSGTDIKYDFSIQMGQSKIPYKDLVAAPLRQGKLNDRDLQLLPKLAVKYNLPNGLSNIYASVSKGYRNGGYNIQMFSDIIQGDMRSAMMTGINEASKGMMQRFVDMESMTALQDVDVVGYKPEYSFNYELGTHLTYPDLRLRLDAALYFSTIRDQQIARFAPSGLGRMMVNAGESRSLGGELSFQWKPIEGLSLAANYGYTEAKFEKYDDGSKADYSGNFIPYAPQNTFSLDVAYSWKKLTLGVNANGAGRIYWNEANTSWQDFYLLPGARLSYEGRIATVTLWGKNLSDTHYNCFAFSSAGLDYEQHGKPLQVGIDIKFSFR